MEKLHHQQLCTPSDIRHPKSLQNLIDAVKFARNKKLSIRALRSSHSFSNIAPSFDGGILLDSHGMNRVLKVDTDSLRDPTPTNTLFSVESGITIKDLNDKLHDRALALLNMGAYDGQTLAGAISTGTHGTGITLGPMASSVRALVLVLENGTVYQIEPFNGISDPAKFEAGNSSIILKQNDGWFYSAVIAMGCMGLIYSYVLEVMPSYFLKENRSLTTWEQVKTELMFTPGGGIPAVLTENRHFEIDINPYTVKFQHSCVVQKKNLDPGPEHGSRGIAD
jgi:FAD/FMN-containing dehydrogenase